MVGQRKIIRIINTWITRVRKTREIVNGVETEVTEQEIDQAMIPVYKNQVRKILSVRKLYGMGWDRPGGMISKDVRLECGHRFSVEPKSKLRRFMKVECASCEPLEVGEPITLAQEAAFWKSYDVIDGRLEAR